MQRAASAAAAAAANGTPAAAPAAQAANGQQQPAAAANAAAAPQLQPPIPPFDHNLFAQMIHNARFGLPPPPPPMAAAAAAAAAAAPPQPAPARPATEPSAAGANTTAATATTATATAAATTTAAANGLPPFVAPAAAGATTFPPFPPMPMPVPPPFGFAPPPYTVPLPMPPPNFSGMTDEELSAMEGTERANVEARVKVLRNIQVLLDAAVMEMQQYSSVVSSLTPSPNTVNRPPAAEFQQKDTNKTEDVKTKTADDAAVPKDLGRFNSDAASAAAKPAPTKETGAIPKTAAAKTADKTAVKTEVKGEEAEEIIRKMDAATAAKPAATAATAITAASGDGSKTEMDEIRRRRLEKLMGVGINTQSKRERRER